MARMTDIVIEWHKRRSSIDYKCIKGLAAARTWEQKDKVVKQWREELSSLDQATVFSNRNAVTK